MVDLIVYAIPAFVALLVIEAVSFKFAQREDMKGSGPSRARRSASATAS